MKERERPMRRQIALVLRAANDHKIGSPECAAAVDEALKLHMALAKDADVAEAKLRGLSAVVTDDVLREATAKLNGYVVVEEDCRGKPTAIRSPDATMCIAVIDVLRVLNAARSLRPEVSP